MAARRVPRQAAEPILQQRHGRCVVTMAAELVSHLVADVEAIRRKAVRRDALPPPLIPVGVRLRVRRTPIDLAVFFQIMKDTGAVAKVAAFHLIESAWREEPTGTLASTPEVRLREAAGIEDRKTWRRVRATALRPFALCSDGRYHCHLLADAIAAISRRQGGANARAYAPLHRGKCPAGVVANQGANTEQRPTTSAFGPDLPTFLSSNRQSVYV
jgi:hypothetical protein